MSRGQVGVAGKLALILIVFPWIVAMMVSGETSVGASAGVPFFLFKLFVLPCGAILLVAFATVVSSLGMGTTLRALRFIFTPLRSRDLAARVAHARELELVRTGDALALGARVVLLFSLLWMTAEVLSGLAMVDAVLGGAEQNPNPAWLARGISGAFFSAIYALGVGRMLLANCADAAYRASAHPERRTFSGWEDVALLVYLLPIFSVISGAFWKWPTIR